VPAERAGAAGHAHDVGHVAGAEPPAGAHEQGLGGGHRVAVGEALGLLLEQLDALAQPAAAHRRHAGQAACLGPRLVARGGVVGDRGEVLQRALGVPGLQRVAGRLDLAAPGGGRLGAELRRALPAALGLDRRAAPAGVERRLLERRGGRLVGPAAAVARCRARRVTSGATAASTRWVARRLDGSIAA
jgi:hypothetical protein